jgi:hypothetical protein
MQILTRNMRFFYRTGSIIFIVLALSLEFNTLFGQSIALSLQKTDTLYRDGEFTFLTDINGDTCSLAIVKTGIEGIRFYTNLSVEKVESGEGEYRVWIANRSSLFKMSVPGFPLFEYKLQRSSGRPVIYLFILTTEAVSHESVIVYNDTVPPVFSINTNPERANIYVMNTLIGKTPLHMPLNQPGEVFKYNIRKSGYLPFDGVDSVRTEDYILNIDLIQRSKEKMYFIEFLTGPVWFNDLIKLSENSYRDNVARWIHGIMFGKTGGTGWYSSARIGFISWTYEGHLDSPQFNDLRISAGLTQSLARSFQAYAVLGAGYAYSENKDIGNYGVVNDYDFSGPFFDTGVIFKFGKRIQVTGEIAWLLGKIQNYKMGEEVFEFGLTTEGSLGFGYSFLLNKKKK